MSKCAGGALGDVALATINLAVESNGSNLPLIVSFGETEEFNHDPCEGVIFCVRSDGVAVLRESSGAGTRFIQVRLSRAELLGLRDGIEAAGLLDFRPMVQMPPGAGHYTLMVADQGGYRTQRWTGGQILLDPPEDRKFAEAWEWTLEIARSFIASAQMRGFAVIDCDMAWSLYCGAEIG